MSKIGKRTVTVEYSKKEIDWKAIAVAIAQQYLKTRCISNDQTRAGSKAG